MPRSCCVPNCNSNYKSSGKTYVPVFTFPTDEHRRKLWIERIPRKNFIITNNIGVCIHHFTESDVLKEMIATRLDGSEITVPRKKLELKPHAVPSVFPKLDSGVTVSHHKHTEKRKHSGRFRRSKMVKKRKSLSPSPSKSESKEERSLGGDDVANARDRLKGALQELLEHSDDSSTSSHEDSVNHEDLIRQLSKKDSSPVPAKPKSQVQKKRKKQEDQNDTGYHHAFVMKLFDRSVDLAPFSENTALYPICRAWITNKPQTSSLKSKTQTPTPEPPEVTEGKKEDDVNKETYRLPPPIKFSDEAARRKIRMPSPVRHEDTEILDINADPKAAPSRESLLEGHVKHWTAVRKKWHKYAHINEERYGKSVEILKELFKKLE